MERMIKVFSGFGYDFYQSLKPAKNGKTFYNIVKKNDPAPAGGYFDNEYICKVKGVPNAFVNSKLSIS